MKRVSFALVLIITATVLFSGCYDGREIDETAYIIAIGIDGADDGEYKYTFQFSAPLAMIGEGGEKKSEDEESGEIKDSGNPSVRNVVIKAPDFYIAKNMINNFMSKNIDMSHLKLIVFSKDIDAQKLIRHSQLFLREREVRPHTSLAVAEDSAEEFIRSVNPELEVNTAKYYELMSLRSNNVYAPAKRLRDFVEECDMGGSSVVPVACVPRNEGSENFERMGEKDALWVKSGNSTVSSSRAEMRGMAVFSDGKLKSIQSGDDALVFNILSRGIKSFMMSIKNENKEGETITFRVYLPQKAEYEISFADGEYVVFADVLIDAEYIGERLPDGYTTSDELYDRLKKAMTDLIYAFFDMTTENGADIMNIGDFYKRKFLTIDDFEKEEWIKIYKDAHFKVDIKVI